MKKLNILHINPFEKNENIEKIILNYKNEFEKLGHTFNIKSNINLNNNYDIIHIHDNKLLNELIEKNISYIYSLHEELLNYNSKNYEKYFNIIKNSNITLVHNENLIDFFTNSDKIFYLEGNLNSSINRHEKSNNKKYEWNIIAKKLENIYYGIIDLKTNINDDEFIKKIINVYNNTKIINRKHIEPKPNIISDFTDGPKISIYSFIDDNTKYKVDFIDSKNNNIIYSSEIKNNQWTKCIRKFYTKWKIKITNLSNNDIYYINFDLNNKNVFIKINTNNLNYIKSWIKSIEKFKLKHNCVIYCYSDYYKLFENEYKNIIFIKNENELNNIKIYTNYYLSETNDINLNPLNDNGNNIADNILNLK